MEKEKKDLKGRDTKGYKRFLLVFTGITLLVSNGLVVCASNGNYAEAGAKWLLGQLFWVALAVVIIVVLILAAKRNFVAALTSAIVGAIVVFLIQNPQTLEDIGNSIMRAVIK